MYIKYCCGCGLCKASGVAEMIKNKEGFYVAYGSSKDFEKFCRDVCPASGVQMKEYSTNSVWGKYQSVHLGFSTNGQVRYRASSGGILTALCLYLIDKRIVDGIIHTAVDPENPISTKTFCSTSVEEIKERCGSRYSASTPLTDLKRYFVGEKKYAYIGKPCDVTALRNYSKLNADVDKYIKYMFSFFCAGAPSEKANLKLLKNLGVEQKECVSLKYRGNGWPGFATAIDKNGKEYRMPYEKAWGKILGRDIRPICRFCADGIGEAADIACADAWYLDKNKNPLFEEADGRNIIFCRNEKGSELLNLAVNAGYIRCSDYPNWNAEINNYQRYQLQRRTTMNTTMLAMKTLGKEVPMYKKSVLKFYAKEISFKEKVHRYLGTIKRILQGKIK